MTEYVNVPIETDPEALAEIAYAYLEEKIENWTPAEGNLDVWILAAAARMAAEVRDVASDVPAAIFRYYGATILGVVPVDATEAVGDTTWVMRDNAGYDVPAGTVIGARDPNGDLIAFETNEDFSVAPGVATTAAGAVPITALEAGVDGNGLTGIIELVDQLDFVASITLVGATTGGTDAETDEEYLSRLKLQTQLMAPRPIKPVDFALLAKNIAGVDRAVALDLYAPNPPGNGLFNNEDTVTVAVVDPLGNAVSGTIKTAVDVYLTSLREVNFQVFVIDPTFTIIDVQYTGTAHSGFVAIEVRDRVNAALADYLSSANWGRPQFGDSGTGWQNKTLVEAYELATVINNIEGFDRLTALTFGIQGGAMNNTPVTLAGVAPLAKNGVMTGTVT